jgi:hypothetical protein
VPGKQRQILNAPNGQDWVGPRQAFDPPRQDPSAWETPEDKVGMQHPQRSLCAALLLAPCQLHLILRACLHCSTTSPLPTQRIPPTSKGMGA